MTAYWSAIGDDLTTLCVAIGKLRPMWFLFGLKTTQFCFGLVWNYDVPPVRLSILLGFIRITVYRP